MTFTDTVSTGINEAGSALDLLLSPNPTTGTFTIRSGDNGTISIQLIDVLGTKVKTYTMTGSQQIIDISDLAAGIYEVQFSDERQVEKVMKE